ncbi:response regulator transcription factor [Iamia majanohamensis]|uniref:Response regulator transcription factor n=1 Tax=Iamia majanohamensis TaxID=467976 RepID=A0AAF0BWV7_9ACTN|nr:response regulator transcription factor [Iamia majanohamensis]WCO68245.1 response regulator transcription factor [Iamia majanohamensis]
MHTHDDCEACRRLEARCARLEQELAEARRALARAERPVPGVDPGDLPTLTSREVEVLDLIAQGLSTDQIGAELYLSRNSVKTHTRKLYRKLGVSSRTEAAIWALNRSRPEGRERPAGEEEGRP